METVEIRVIELAIYLFDTFVSEEYGLPEMVIHP